MLFFTGSYSNNVFPEPLSEEEEKIAIQKMQNGDKDARAKLIEHNLRLVAHIVKKYDTSNKNTDDLISSSDIMITGKIVYVKIEFEKNASLVEAQGKALELLDEFSDEEKAFYDFQFMLKQNSTDNSDGFIISGSKNANGTKLSWSNNRPVKSEASSA